MRSWLIAAALLAATPVVSSPVRASSTLRFALDFDFDTFDPARSGSYIERVVNTAMCDQLIDIDPQLNLVPQLATSWAWSDNNLALTLKLRPGVIFSDGAPFDAEAVRANIERYRTAPYSLRRTELKAVAGVDVLDAHTVRINLSEPFTPLVALLANRPGVMLSPRIFNQSTAEISAHPVCAGPFTLAERVAQDHVTLKRFPGYWDAEHVQLDGIEFKIMTDSTVRLVNLQSGKLDVANRLAATDVPAVQADKRMQVVSSPSIGFEMISFNLGNGAAANTPFGKDDRIRQAFAKSIDRASLNQVVFEGRMIPSNQTETPDGKYWNPAFPVPERDVDGAKALLAQAGVPHPKLVLSVTNAPTDVQVGEVIQAMAGEAGFEVSLQKGESVAQTQAARRGDYQADLVIWSGRPYPDGNLASWMRCGAPLNWTGWCSKEMDAALDRGTAAPGEAARVTAYREATAIWMRDMPYMVLYHFTWFWGLSDKVQGFQPRPDGLVRMVGVSLP